MKKPPQSLSSILIFLNEHLLIDINVEDSSYRYIAPPHPCVDGLSHVHSSNLISEPHPDAIR
jgi:hypothetical protein